MFCSRFQRALSLVSIHLIAVLTVLLCTPGLAAADSAASDSWRAFGADTRFSFHPGVLEALKLEVVSDLGPLTVSDATALDFRSDHPFGLRFAAPYGAFAGFEDGELRHRGGFTLAWPGGSADFRDFVLRPVRGAVEGRIGDDISLDMLDAQGTALLYLDHIHSQLFAREGRLELRWMDVRITEELARRMDKPEAAGLAVAVAHLTADAHGQLDPSPLGGCTTPNFSLPIDVELSSINSVQQTAREAGVRVAITPSATLRNVGQGDVEWYPAFEGQHPYLVWSLYRIAGGRIEQLGRSPLKHAFFSVNSSCACSGGNILWVGCGDTYGVSTNESRTWLAPREELEAHTGLWDECSSHFDGSPQDCSRSHNSSGHDTFEHRLVVAEGDLSTAGAKYLFDSWYLVKDDIDIFNTMGYREVVPSFVGDTWTFGFATSLVLGSVLDDWVDPTSPPAGTANHTVATADGHVQLAVQTTDLGGGVWRYEYALLNHDLDRRIARLSIPRTPGAAITAVGFGDPDDNPANDWHATLSPNAVEWNRTAVDDGQDWGTLHNFWFEADQPPQTSSAGLVADESGAELPRPTTLAPGDDSPIFDDGFETGNTSRWSSATL